MVYHGTYHGTMVYHGTYHGTMVYHGTNHGTYSTYYVLVPLVHSWIMFVLANSML